MTNWKYLKALLVMADVLYINVFKNIPFNEAVAYKVYMK